MANLRTRCTHCGQALTLKKPELVGRKVACPSCRQPFLVRPIKASESASTRTPGAKPGANEDDVLDAAVVDDSMPDGSDDDWLSAIDSIQAESVSAGTAGEAPRVRSSRKRKKKSTDTSRPRTLRDADGDLPLWLHRLMMMGSGIIGGLIATLIWAVVIFMLEVPSSWMAILVGVFVGTAVRFGASRWDYGWWPAVTASLIACVTIFAGKIAGFFLLERQFVAEMDEHDAAYLAMIRHEDYPISLLAMEIQYEQFEAGQLDMALEDWEWEEDVMDDNPDWSEIYNPERFPEQYAGTWEAATQRWQQLPDEEKMVRLRLVEQEIALIESGDWHGYEASVGGLEVISIWDLICSIIAIIAAFRIAAGWEDDD